jgi:hypothetical protein
MATSNLPKWTANAYATPLGDADVMTALRETPERIRALVDGFSPAQMASSYAPGKWTAAQLLVHLAQCEFVFGTRVRMALSLDGFVAQPFDQDAWLAREAGTDGLAAFHAYYATRQMNLALFSTLTEAERERPLSHPERGRMHVEWILEMLAGHERHHEAHFRTIAGLPAS